MDSDHEWTIIFFALIMAVVIGVAYITADNNRKVMLAEYKEIQLFQDSQKRIDVPGGDIWWKIGSSGINYSQTVYAFNPNKYEVGLDIFFEAFPAELSQYCLFGNGTVRSVGGENTAEITLTVFVSENQYLGLSTKPGDIVTQIKGVIPE